MKKTLEARLNSQIQAQMTLEKYQTLFGSVSVLNDAFKKLSELIKEAKELRTQAASSPSKTAGNKSLAKEELISVVVKLSNAVKVYASLNKDENLLNQLVTSENSMISKMRGGDLLSYSYFLQETIEKNPDALSPFGVNEQLISDLKSEIIDYAAVENEPRQLISERKTSKELLEDSIGNIADLLRNQIDPLMELFVDEKEFYLQYKSARMIVDPAFRSKSETPSN